MRTSCPAKDRHLDYITNPPNATRKMPEYKVAATVSVSHDTQRWRGRRGTGSRMDHVTSAATPGTGPAVSHSTGRVNVMRPSNDAPENLCDRNENPGSCESRSQLDVPGSFILRSQTLAANPVPCSGPAGPWITKQWR